MATSVVSPTDSGSSDFGSELGGLINESFDPGTEESPGGEGGSEQPAQSPSLDDVPGGESPTGETAPEGAEESGFKLAEDGQNYLVPKSELSVYTGLKQYVDQVQQWFPTSGDAQVAHQMSSDLQAINADFESGEPGRIDAVLQHFAGMNAADPYMRDQCRQSFASLVTRAPEVLKQINPQAYQQLANSLIQPRIDAAYAKAAETGDPKDLFRAQNMDWLVRGEYHQAAPARPDPAAQQQNAQQSRLSEIEQRENALLQRDFTTFNNTQLDGPKWQQFNAAIDQVLAPVKAKYSPEVFDGIRMKVEKEVLGKLRADADWASIHSNERAMLERSFSQVWKNRQDPNVLKDRVQRYQNDFLIRARRAIGPIVAPILNGATAKAVAKPAAKPQAQARPQQSPSQQAPQQQKHYSMNEDPEWSKIFRSA